MLKTWTKFGIAGGIWGLISLIGIFARMGPTAAGMPQPLGLWEKAILFPGYLFSAFYSTIVDFGFVEKVLFKLPEWVEPVALLIFMIMPIIIGALIGYVIGRVYTTYRGEKPMDKETKRIIKEEILRSAGVGFFVLLGTVFILVRYELPKNFFTALGIPFVITFSIFIFLVRIRKGTGREFKLKPGTRPYRVFLLFLIAYSVRLIYFVVKSGANQGFWLLVIVLWFIGIGSMIREELKVSK
jgi:hypothetical protein